MADESKEKHSWLKSRSAFTVALSLLSVIALQSACLKPPALISLRDHSLDAEKPADEPTEGGNQGTPPGADSEAPGSGDGTAEIPVDKTETPGGGTAPVKVPGDNPPEPPKSKACVDQSEKCHPHAFIMADEPLRKILFVNLDNPSTNWELSMPGGARDLQLIGDGRVMVGTLDGPGGYHEVDIATGKILKSVLGFGAVGSVQRLKNGNTLLMGEGLNNSPGTVVLEVDPNKVIKNKYVFKDLRGGRMIRRTRAGTFLVGTGQAGKDGKDAMVEVDRTGKELLRLQNNDWPAHMALRMPNGDTVVASGHGKTLMIFDKRGMLKTTLGGPSGPDADAVRPNYSGQFSVLPNGNFLMTNWQGHETTHGRDGRQIIEYDASGKLVWWWKQQNEAKISSIHSVLVLDNLDLNQAYDDTNGMLEPLQ